MRLILEHSADTDPAEVADMVTQLQAHGLPVTARSVESFEFKPSVTVADDRPLALDGDFRIPAGRP